MFCDLVGSVNLHGPVALEDMVPYVMDAYLAACNDVIGRHGGYIIQYMGDGVLAYFGYPRAN